MKEVIKDTRNIVNFDQEIAKRYIKLKMEASPKINRLRLVSKLLTKQELSFENKITIYYPFIFTEIDKSKISSELLNKIETAIDFWVEELSNAKNDNNMKINEENINMFKECLFKIIFHSITKTGKSYLKTTNFSDLPLAVASYIANIEADFSKFTELIVDVNYIRYRKINEGNFWIIIPEKNYKLKNNK